jgi:phosphoglycerate dehydrogenase-like enzyme
MSHAIVVTPDFDAVWPFTADHLRDLWLRHGPVELFRADPANRGPASALVREPASVTSLVCLGVPLTPACLDQMVNLREVVLAHLATDHDEAIRQRGIVIHRLKSEAFWGQSVSEFALGLTLSALRRIPQTHAKMQRDLSVWDYSPPGGVGAPGARGAQYGDDSRFINGTLAGKRVRIVGAGNIGSRYASFCSFLGADVAAWDPLAPDPCFHRTGARRVRRLEDLLDDAEIFAPMVPLTDKTRGIVEAHHIDRLPKGALVVLVTRAEVCAFPALRRRVLAGELALAADVFDVEPLPLNDPLLGLEHVVHTPHNAGRTRDANFTRAEMFLGLIL